MNPALQTWLEAATRGLAPASAARIRQAYAHSPQAPGEPPTAANRRFKKRYATQRDLAHLDSYVSGFLIWMGLVAALTVIGLGSALDPVLTGRLGEGDADLVLILGGLFAFCLMLSQWQRIPHWTIRRLGLRGLYFVHALLRSLTFLAIPVASALAASDLMGLTFLLPLAILLLHAAYASKTFDQRLRATYTNDQLAIILKEIGLTAHPPRDAQHRPKSF